MLEISEIYRIHIEVTIKLHKLVWSHWHTDLSGFYWPIFSANHKRLTSTLLDRCHFHLRKNMTLPSKETSLVQCATASKLDLGGKSFQSRWTIESSGAFQPSPSPSWNLFICILMAGVTLPVTCHLRYLTGFHLCVPALPLSISEH